MKKFINQERKRGIDLETEEVITLEQLQKIYDKAPSKSNDYLIDIFKQLEKTDVSILTDPLIVNHEFYPFITDKLEDLLILWNTEEHLVQFDSALFHHIIQILCKIKLSPNQLIQSIEKCLKEIANNGKFLNDKNNIENFSNLVGLYTQNEQIIEAIVQYLCSKYYIEMFQSINNVLLVFPTYWMSYKGPHREELSNILLNNLLIFSADILQKKPTQQLEKPLTQFIDLFSHCLTWCDITIFKNDLWMDIIRVLLSLLNEELLLKERKSLIKSITYLLLILINNEEQNCEYVKEFQERFEILIETENEACLILTSLINDSEIQTMINKNQNFAQFLREYLQENHNEENIRINLFIKRLKKFLVDEDIGQRVAPTTLPLQPMIVSNENKNQEEITLIWFDKNIDTKNNNTNRTVELLQQINDYVLIYSDRKTFIQYIEQIKTEKVFLIISGSNAAEILEEIHHHKQIDSIFIFCMDYAKYQIYLNNNNFYKVVGIYTEYEPLLTAIQENIRYLIKQSEAAGLFDQEERSIRNLNRESYSFNHFLAFKYVLLKTTYNNDIAKREMIEICRNYYRNNKKELLNIDEFERTYQSKDAIYWYTKQSFIYRLVNKALRTEDYTAIIVLRFFIVDLSENLREEYQNLKRHSKTIVSYRGLQLTPPEIHNFKHNIDATIATNGFLSTSRSKDIAYRFARKTAKHPNVETVMLEISVDLSKVTTSLADVAESSDYPEEQEILFDLGASFTIDSVDYDSIQKIWFVKLEAQSEGSMIDDIQTVLKAYRSENDMNILLGKLLFKMEKDAICRKYFENLLNFYENDEYESLAKIYNFIGHTSALLKDYDKAIANNTKALEYYTLLNRLEDVARVTNMIGISYSLKKDKDNERLYCQKSHEIWKQLPAYTSENPPCEIGRLMLCLGDLENNNQIACDYFFKALKIYQNPSETCEHTDHDYNIAIQYESLADRYHKDNDYEKAFEYIMKSIPIRQKHVSTPKMRAYYFFCLCTLKTICQKIHEDVWVQYENEFSQLMDMDYVQLYPESKDIFDDINTVRRAQFLNDNNTSAEFLEHSLKSLKYLLKTDPNNYQKIIQAYIDIGLAYAKANEYHWSSQNYQKALEMCQTYLPNDSEHMSTIYEHLSDISLKRNDIHQAFSLRMKSLTINEKTRHLSTKENEAQCYYDIAYRLPKTDADKKLGFYTKSLEIRQEILPEDNIDIGLCHSNIGIFYRKKCMFDTALEHYKKAIGIYEKNISDPYAKELSCTCYSIIATIYACQKKYDDAFDFKMKEINSVDKYSHLTVKEREAQCYFDIGEDLVEGDTDKALDFFQTSLEIREEILPPDHANIGVCHQSIGTAYEKKTMLDMALDHYKKAIEIYEKHQIDQQEYQFNIKGLYIHCHSSLVGIHCQHQNYDDAFTCRMKALTIDERYFDLTEKGKEAQCYFDIGYDLILSELDQVFEFLFKSLEIRQQILSSDHITIGFCYDAIGMAYNCRYKLDLAIEYYTKAVKIFKKHLFDKVDYQFNVKQHYILCHSNLFEICSQQRKYDHAFASRRELSNIDEKYAHLTEQEKEAQYYVDLGENLTDRDADKALEYFQRSLKIRDEILPSDHVNIGVCYGNIGAAYEAKSIFDLALEYYTKAAEIYEKHLFDQENSQYDVKKLYINCHSSMVSIFYKQKKYDHAFTSKMKVLNFDEKYLHLTEKEKEAQCYFDFGNASFDKDAKRALEFYQKSLEIRQEILPSDHPNIGFCHHNIGNIYEKKSKLDTALEHYSKAIDIYEKHLFDQEEYQFNIKELYIKCHSNMIGIYCQQQNYGEAFTSKMKVFNSDEKYSHLTEKEKEAQCYYDCGSDWFSKDDNRALEFYQKSLEIRDEILPLNHANIGFCHQDIGVVYENKSIFPLALEHYKKAIDIYEKHLFDQEEYQFNIKELYIRCHSNLVGVYCQQRNYDEALTFKMKVLNLDEKYSHLTEKEKEAQCYYDFGRALFDKDTNRALVFYQKLLEIRQEILPSDHVNIAFCHQNTGNIYEKKSKLDTALEHYSKAIDIYEKHLFDQEEYQFNIKELYIKCHSNMIGIYCQQQNYGEAFTSKMKVFNLDEKYSHLTEKEKEAQCYYDFGNDSFDKDANRALEFCQKSLEIRQKILPSDHVNIGLCHHYIGAIYQKTSMLAMALEHYSKAIEIYEKHLFDQEENQYDVKKLYIQCHSNSVGIYFQQQNYDEAFVFKMKVFNFDEKYSHLTEKEKEAQCYYDFGDDLFSKEANIALEFYQKSLEIRQEILPSDHVNIAFCHQNIGVIYAKKSILDTALEHYSKATEIYEKNLFDKGESQLNVKQLYGDCHKDMCKCHLNMKKREYVNALNYALSALQIYQEYCPENKKSIAQCYWNHGYILTKKGQYDEAIIQMQKSLDTLLNENDIVIALSYHILGYCYEKKCEYEQALSFYQIALRNYEQYLINLNDENVAYVLGDIGACLLKLKQYDQALEYSIKSMEILEQIVPMIHVPRAAAHSLLALIYSKLSQNDKCNEHRINALEISEQWILNDEGIKYLPVVFENIGELYITENNFQMAETYFKKTLEFIKKEKTDDHPDILRIQKIIDELSNNSRIDLLNDESATFL